MTTQNIYSLLNDPDKIVELFYDFELHLNGNFFIIDPQTKEYDVNWKRDYTDILSQMQYVHKSYNDGKTIIIKKLENFINLSEEFGKDIDIHAYIVPQKQDSSGDSFGWHTDDRSVWIKMLWGSKIFALRYQANETVMENYIKVNPGDKIFIKKGQYHKASPMGSSCLLSIGLPDSNLKDI
jgi:hypothetical protein